MIKYLIKGSSILIVSRLVYPGEEKRPYDFAFISEVSRWFRLCDGGSVATTRNWRWDAEDEWDIRFYSPGALNEINLIYKFIRFKTPCTTGELGFLVFTSSILQE
jgi:hypothetical protein